MRPQPPFLNNWVGLGGEKVMCAKEEEKKNRKKKCFRDPKTPNKSRFPYFVIVPLRVFYFNIVLV